MARKKTPETPEEEVIETESITEEVTEEERVEKEVQKNIESDPTEEEVVEPDVPQKYVCIKDCTFDNQLYKPGNPLVWAGDMPNKNFQLASIPVIPPAKEAVSALPKTLRDQLRDLTTLNGLNLDEELEKRGISSLAAWPAADAVKFIEELRIKYEKKKRQGPEVRSDVSTGEEPEE